MLLRNHKICPLQLLSQPVSLSSFVLAGKKFIKEQIKKNRPTAVCKTSDNGQRHPGFHPTKKECPFVVNRAAVEHRSMDGSVSE